MEFSLFGLLRARLASNRDLYESFTRFDAVAHPNGLNGDQDHGAIIMFLTFYNHFHA